jgi:hypothetical protein
MNVTPLRQRRLLVCGIVRRNGTRTLVVPDHAGTRVRVDVWPRLQLVRDRQPATSATTTPEAA